MLASDVGPAPMQVGALLVLDVAPGFDVAVAKQLIAERLAAIPRLRQRLVRVPLGFGRPVWVDDPAFDIHAHVQQVPCPAPGDEQAVLDLAADLVATRLSRAHPLWAARLITGLDGGQLALVIAFHHVVADGIGGLSVLTRLIEGSPTSAGTARVRPPTLRRLAADAQVARLRWLHQFPPKVARLRLAFAELGAARPPRAPRCSLNQPTGPRRRLAVARIALAEVRAVAHRAGATVNDVALTAVVGALATLLTRRGEEIDWLDVSVPVSGRTDAGGRLGNRVGVMPVVLPTGGPPRDRLGRVAAITRQRKGQVPGASSSVMGPAFRALAAIRAFRWFINHQPLVNTFVSNVRGPDQLLAVEGATITDIVPISVNPGNVTVAFDVFSYAGQLSITVIADPARVADLSVLVDALQEELVNLAASGVAAG